MPPRLSAQREGGSVFLLDGEELIPEGDLCFVVSEVVEGLELMEFEEGYSRLGRKGYHPRTLLKVMIYGYLAGARSSRELERRTETDVRYMWLAGRERPEHNTFARFRRRNLGGFEWLFREVLKVKEVLRKAGACKDEERINETDPQCRVMRGGNGSDATEP